MNATVNENCIGCGLCCATCDAVFRLNAEGKSEAYGTVTEENQADVQTAIDNCPVSAISWQ